MPYLGYMYYYHNLSNDGGCCNSMEYRECREEANSGEILAVVVNFPAVIALGVSNLSPLIRTSRSPSIRRRCQPLLIRSVILSGVLEMGH